MCGLGGFLCLCKLGRTVSRTRMNRYNQGRRLVVGCIPYRYKSESDGSIKGELEVLVISSKKGQGMMFPEGGWEIYESVEEAASIKCLVKAGVLGEVERILGHWSFIGKRYGTFYEGYMFPLLVKEQLELWPEKNERQRVWMNVAEAREVCQHCWMKKALDVLVRRLTTLPQHPRADVL